MKTVTLLLVFSLAMLGCMKEESAPKQLKSYSVAYSATCADCEIVYNLPDGQWDTVSMKGSFSSDTFVFQEDNFAYIYAYSNTTASPEEVVIYSPGDTSIYWSTKPRANELVLKGAWFVGYP